MTRYTIQELLRSAATARIALKLVLVLAAVLPAGCGAGMTYLKDRALDVTDIVDAKVGGCLGLGVKAEVTDYLSAGLGLGETSSGYETFGRRVHPFDHFFMYFAVLGYDGHEEDLTAVEYFFYNTYMGPRPPMIHRFRLGAEALLPGFMLGLYVNPAEMLDLVLGLATVDIAGDDGLRKGAPLFREERGEEGGIPRPGSKDLMYDLFNPEVEVRSEAAIALGLRNADYAVYSLILAICHDPEERVRGHAARALDRITGKDLGTDGDAWRAWWDREGKWRYPER